MVGVSWRLSSVPTGRDQSANDESFFGNDILRVKDGRFVEYWTASSAGS